MRNKLVAFPQNPEVSDILSVSSIIELLWREGPRGGMMKTSSTSPERLIRANQINNQASPDSYKDCCYNKGKG